MKKKLPFLLLTLLLVFSCESDEASEPIIVPEEHSTDLFLSEYVEGSSFNKALEIVNLTGEDVDLEEMGYSIRKQSNGTGDWQADFPLTGTLAHNEVHVIANSSAELLEIVNNADQLKSGAPMDFNGNDPVGLFREGVLIDIVGEIGTVVDFAKDVTLRRKQEFQEPSLDFVPEEWEILEMDSVEGIGNY